MGERKTPKTFHSHCEKTDGYSGQRRKARKSIKKLSDGGGLVLLVHPSGSKYWSYRYRYLGKEKSLSLAVYPEVSLGEARQKLMDARKIVAEGNAHPRRANR